MSERASATEVNAAGRPASTGPRRAGKSSGTSTDPCAEVGTWLAGSALEAVRAAEARICGDAAVRRQALAEGLALAGRRAACVPAAVEPPEPRVVAGTHAAWVRHRVGALRPAEPEPGFAIEFAAADAQTAVDLCFVAHRVAEALGSPCVCTLDPALASRLDLACLPEPDATDRLFASPPPPHAGAMAAAVEAFDAVRGWTGRSAGPVSSHGADGARAVIVAAGAAAVPARAAADALTAAGTPCGAVIVTLLDPFPRAMLADRLRDARSVVVLDPADGRLFAHVRSALGDDAAARAHEVRWPVERGAAPFDRVASALGVELRPPTEGAADAPRVALAVSPKSTWGERLLLDVAARLREGGPVSIGRHDCAAPGLAALAFGGGSRLEPRPGLLDALLVADPTWPAAWAALDEVKDDGVVLVAGLGGTPEALWPGLPAGIRRRLADAPYRVVWLDPASATEGPLDPGTARRQLVDALLDAVPMPSGIRPPSALAPAAPRGLRRLDPRELEGTLRGREGLAGAGTLGRMPEPVPGAEGSEWIAALRHFHLTGQGARSAADPAPLGPLAPLALSALREDERAWRDDPLLLSGAAATGLGATLEKCLGALREAGIEAPVLGRHPECLPRAAARRLARAGHDGEPLPQALDAALEHVGDEFDLSAAGQAALAAEIAALRERLPREGRLLALSDALPVVLYADATQRTRAAARTALLDEVRGLITRLGELIVLDDAQSERGTSADAVAGTLGAAGGFVDPATFARTRPARRGSAPLEPDRRARIERVRAALERFCADADTDCAWLVVRADADLPGGPPAACRVIEHPDPLRAALGIFEGRAARTVETLRAVRVARLEVERAYDPELHAAILERFDWQAFSRDEMALLPPVAVVTTGAALRRGGLAAFSELLRSSRPVHVLVLERLGDLGPEQASDELAGYSPGLGYLAVAHREALVLQSTLGHTEHLVAGLARIAAATGPAAALIALPGRAGAASPWLQLAAAREGRATPCFVYDPSAGPTWAERFDLSGNPAPESAWPEHELRYVDAQGSERTLRDAFTFAHAAALDPAYRDHFRVIPVEAWSAEQLDLAAFLDLAEDARRTRVPFVWVRRAGGELARAVVTRELAWACRDRMSAWRIYQELAGTNNEYARRSAELARLETLVAAERERESLVREHGAELARVRESTARETMERLAQVLLGTELSALPAAARAEAPRPAAPPAAVLAAPVPVPEPAPAPAQPEPAFVEDPYIDSMLCTTCNECINLNPRMFRYNANKQAQIVDPAAGSFAQLVQAAEKCPARCIHPGAPRADDSTATPEVVARARAFA